MQNIKAPKPTTHKNTQLCYIYVTLYLCIHWFQIKQFHRSSENSYETKISELKLELLKEQDQISHLQESVTALTLDLKLKQAEISKYVEEINDVKTRQAAEISELVVNHAKEREKTSLAREEEIEQLLNESVETAAGLQEENVSKCRELELEYGEVVTKLHRERGEELAKVKEGCKEEVVKVRELFVAIGI